MRDTKNTSYDLRYDNPRQLIGEYWTSGFSEGVYDTQDGFILSGFSLFGCEPSWVHRFIGGRVCRSPESVLYTTAHPPSHTGPPVHELVVCAGFIKVF